MFIFPVHLFNPLNVKAGIMPRTISGGVALNGDEDFIATDGGGRWEIEFSGITLNTPTLQRQWDAWMDYLDGGVTACLVPTVSLHTAPRPYVDNHPMRAPAILTDDPLWPTAITYAQPYIEAELTAAAILRATTIALDVTRGGTIKGGEVFSVGERAYRLQRPGAAPGQWIIRPPLRGAVNDGDALNFNWPVVKCRLDPRDEIPDIFASRVGEVGIRFVEYDR